MANLLSAHRDLANPQHRAEVAALWGVAVGAGQAGQDGRRNVPGRGRRRDQGVVDRVHQPGAIDARPGDGAPRAGARRVRRGAGSLRHHRHLRLRRPAAARDDLGREDRHGDQQRAPHQPGARRPSPSPAKRATTGPSRPSSRAASNANCAPASPRSSPTRSPMKRPEREAIWNEHRESTRGRDLDITGMSYAVARRRRPAAVAVPVPVQSGRNRRGSTKTASFPHADGKARFRQRRLAAGGRAARMRAIRSR